MDELPKISGSWDAPRRTHGRVAPRNGDCCYTKGGGPLREQQTVVERVFAGEKWYDLRKVRFLAKVRGQVL